MPVPEAERHHLRVRRADFELPHPWLNGAGWRGLGRLTEQGATLEVLEADQVAPPSPLVLAVAIGDKERWLWLAEKSAELGVTDLLPVACERSAHVATRLREAQLGRVAERAREACKQSGAAWAPVVHPMVSLERLGAALPAGVRRLLADGEGGPFTPDGSRSAGIAVLVGPEGGLSAAERAAVLADGWTACRLAPNVLRFETAALAAAAVIQAHREEP